MTFVHQYLPVAWFKKYGMSPLNLFWLVLLATFSSSFIASSVSAQDSNCSSRVIGERCYQIFRADAGKSGSTSDPHDTNLLSRPVPDGYVVVGYDEVNESTNGGQFTVNTVTRGQRTDIRRDWSAQSTRIADLQQNFDASYKDANSETRAKLDVMKRELEELQSTTNYVNLTNSNIDIFELRATSKYVCTRAAFGNCLDGYGNHGQGYVKVNLVYVGDNPSTEVDRIATQLSLIGQNSGNEAQQQIIGFYRDFLSREPRPDEIEFRMNAFRKGYPLERQRIDIAFSEEVRQKIIGFFRQYLGRDPDSDGITFRMNALLNGRTLEQQRVDIQTSPEARSRQ